MRASHATANSQNSYPAKERADLSTEWISPLLLLLEVDPRHLYACWEVWPEDLAAIGAQKKDIFQNSQLTLRIIEGKEDKGRQQFGSYFDVPVEGWKNDWYIEVPRSDRLYFAELGLKSLASGEFYVIKRSNMVKTPKNTISSPQCQEKWMKVLGEYETVSLISSDELLAQRPSSKYPISQEMVEEYYRHLLSQHQPKKAVEITRLEGTPAGQDEATQGKESREPEGLIPTEAAFSEAIEQEGLSAPEWSSLASLSSLSSSSFGSSFVASDNLPSSLASLELGASFGSPLSSLSSAALSSYSRGDISHSEKAASSRLEASFQYDLDLVIYGRTQPGVTIYIGEDAVPVHPDGSFSWRLNLGRQGKHWICLRAKLPQGGEVREFIPIWFQKIRTSGD